ncbi:MAG: YMGG-like glycine zipper-containing protein [Ginsengibacter sp.]
MKKIFYLLIVIFVFAFFYSYSVNAQAKNSKKHWSHRKKDAVIGGAAGAATGAIISKHPVKGAVIGGAVGAGGGYIIGKKKDKKVANKK